MHFHGHKPRFRVSEEGYHWNFFKNLIKNFKEQDKTLTLIFFQARKIVQISQRKYRKYL
jgi:hypothetical protein